MPLRKLGKVQPCDELEPGELPDQQSPFEPASDGEEILAVASPRPFARPRHSVQPLTEVFAQPLLLRTKGGAAFYFWKLCV